MFKKLFNSKNIPSNNSFDLSEIKKAKAEVDDKNKDSGNEYNTEFATGLIFLKKYNYIQNKENLEQAIIYFINAQKLKKHKAEPYYYLSFIAYLVQEKEIAKQYFEIAEFLNPNLHGLNELKTKISKI